MKYRNRVSAEVVEVINYDDFIQYGKDHAGNLVCGMPWSFEYAGNPVSHETDTCYIVPTPDGIDFFTPCDMLILDAQGDLWSLNKGFFDSAYEVAE